LASFEDKIESRMKMWVKRRMKKDKRKHEDIP
jgi:hypothetical protein